MRRRGTARERVPLLLAVLIVGAAVNAEIARSARETARPFSLARIGFPSLDILGERRRERVSFAYRLPAGARQGDPTWYLVRLDFRISFAEHARAGVAYVSALTNGRAAAQVKFEPFRTRTGALRIRWSSVDLIRGRVERTVAGRSVSVSFTNYLQLAGVRPGRNVFTIEVERFGSALVERVSVFGRSGIERTRRAPGKLKLALALPGEPIHVGEDFQIGFRLVNAGDVPVRRVAVRPIYPRRALAGLGPTQRRFAVLGRARGRFRFRALAPGRYELVVAARSSANRPAVVVDVPIGASPHRTRGVLALLVLAGAGGLGGVAFMASAVVLAVRRRGQRPLSLEDERSAS